MRTLVVVRSLKMGGMERVAVNLADAFADAGHDSHLLSLRHIENPLESENTAVKRHCLSIHWWARATLVGFALELLARLVLNPLLKRSVYLGAGIMGGAVFWLWLKAFEHRHGRVDRLIFRGVGTFEQVWTFRDQRACYVLENVLHTGGNGRQPAWKRLGHKLFGALLLHRRHLVTVSSGVAANLRKAMTAWRVQPASLQIIANPCPLPSIRRRMLEPHPAIPEGTPYLLNVARLVPAKDQDMLLRAYAQSGVMMPLVIVGTGPEYEHLQKLASSLGIAQRVVFAGQQDNPYPLMHHARLFVLSSRFEGMGIVLFEALACGTPVLSVDCPGGIRDILKGELESSVVAHSKEALAEGLRQHSSGDKPPIHDAWLNDFAPERIAAEFLRPLR